MNKKIRIIFYGITFIFISSYSIYANAPELKVKFKVISEKLGTRSIKTNTNGTLSQSQDREKFYILQFKDRQLNQWKEKLKAEEIKYYDYLPEYAYVVKMKESVKNRIKNYSYIHWVGEYYSEYKISDNLWEEEEPVDIIISLFEEDKNIFTFFEENKIEIKENTPRIISVEVNKDKLKLIAGYMSVQSIQINYPVQLLKKKNKNKNKNKNTRTFNMSVEIPPIPQINEVK